MWWRGHFLFEENQNYSKTDDWENKETFPETFIQDFESEIKNVVITSNKTERLIPSTIDNIIKASNYSDINRLFRFTAFVVRFVKNLFRKIKGENLKLFIYADASEIYEAKIQWIKANQLLLSKSENYESLSKNLTLKFNEENIIRCCSRLENGNKNSHHIMLSRNHELNKLIVLTCHKKVYHNVVKQILNELRAEFWINRGRSYVRKLLNSFFICKRLQSRSYSYPENSNLPSYRVNEVCGVDYLGPLYVKDIYYKSSNDDMHKAYIVIFTCATSRSVILDLAEDNSSKSFINSIKRFTARGGCPKKIMSDNGTVFMSQGNQLFWS